MGGNLALGLGHMMEETMKLQFCYFFQVQPILAAKSSENLAAAAAAAEDSKKVGGKGSSSNSSKPEAPPRSKSAKSRQEFAN